MGSYMAECHPVGFRWVMEARERGANDHPRRSALHAHVRDGRHLGADPRRAATSPSSAALVSYVLEHGLDFRDYVVAYTNAATIIGEEFRDTEDLDGLFSGFDPEKREYDIRSWQYQGVDEVVPAAGHKESASSSRGARAIAPRSAPTGRARRDAPASALRLPDPEAPLRALHAGAGRGGLRRAREDVPRGRRGALPTRPAASARRDLLRGRLDAALDRACRSSAPRRSCSCCSATSGGPAAASSRCAVTPRSRARPTSRRSTTCCPATSRCRSRRGATRSTSSSARTRPDRAGGRVPEVHRLAAQGVVRRARHAARTSSASALAAADHRRSLALRLLARRWPTGKIEGCFVMGQNPAVGVAERAARAPALREPEVAGRARHGRDRDRDVLARLARGADAASSAPEQIDTEVFFFPAAAHAEKDGCFTNTQRLLQWHDKRGRAPGRLRGASPGSCITSAGASRRCYARLDRAAATARSSALTWDYPTDGTHRASRASRRCCRRSTASRSPTAALVEGFARPAGRRLDRVRLLDLLGRVSRTAATGARRARAGAGLGTATGGASPGRPIRRHPLQPRLGATRRHAVVRAQEASLVGRRSAREWAGLDVPDFTPDEAARLPARADGAKGRRRDRRRRAVHACTPTACGWLFGRRAA